MEKTGVELAAENVSAFLSALEKATERIEGLGKEAEDTAGKGNILSRALSGMGNIAATALKAGLVAGTAALTALAGAAAASLNAVNDWAGQLDSIQDRLGGTSEAAAALAVAVQGVGGNVDTFTAGLAKMQKGLETADGKLGPAGKALKSLGIDFRDTEGEMLSMDQLLPQIADKLNAIPDGADKSALMMDLMGGAGKDLGDVMAALADGGLAAADEKAKALGLSLGQDTVDATIEMGKQMETAKMAVQGLFVSIGSELLPVILPLIQQLVALAQEHLPPIREWLGVQIPIAVQFLTNLWTTQLQPALSTVAEIITTIVIPAVQSIIGSLQQGGASTSTWASAFETAKGVVEAVVNALEPLITTVFGVISAFLASHGDEIQATLAEAWERIGGIIDVALQVIQAILVPIINFWTTYISTHAGDIQRILDGAWQIIQNIIDAALTLISGILNAALLALQGDWQGAWDVMDQAVNDIWESIKGIIDGALRIMGTSLETELGKAQALWESVWTSIKTFVEGIWNSITGTIQGAIDSIIGFINNLITGFENLTHIQLPDWLTPGSPTPFEMGLRGIGAAMKELAQVTVPQFNAGMQNVRPPASPAGGISNTSHNTSVTNNITMPIYTNNTPAVLPQSLGMMRALVG